MKKFIPCLAMAALLITGCGGASRKISEEKFREEVTDYGFLLNNNAKFEGDAIMMGINADAEMGVNSDGKNISFYFKMKAGEMEMENRLIGEIENNKVKGTIYAYSEGSWEVEPSPEEGITLSQFKGLLATLVYFPTFEMKDFKYDSKEKAYTAESISVTIDFGEPVPFVFSDVTLSFKKNELVSYEYTMSGMGESIELEMERTEAGGVTVEEPNLR